MSATARVEATIFRPTTNNPVASLVLNLNLLIILSINSITDHQPTESPAYTKKGIPKSTNAESAIKLHLKG